MDYIQKKSELKLKVMIKVKEERQKEKKLKGCNIKNSFKSI